MTPQVAQRLGMGVTPGAFVASVSAHGPAAAAGIKADDVITAFDAKPVTDSAGLVSSIRSHQPGDKVAVTLVRGKTTSPSPSS